ncbi:MAG: DUF1839 family protein [Acidimicrobiales bacterium]
MRREVLGLAASEHRSHALHGEGRVWLESNCYVDLWIETLHALELDPVSCLAFTLGTGFDGDQWRMFKYPTEDLRRMFGIDVAEINVWRPLVDHVDEQLGLGRMLAVDVDAWHLPDTAGTTYHCARQKTTIMAQMIDPGARRLGYFHNAGYYELGGDDYDGVLGLGAYEDCERLPPYVEAVNLERLRAPGDGGVALALELVAEHLARRSPSNPIGELRKRLAADLPWLGGAGIDTFHRYAFGTFRQCGANAELAAELVGWLERHGEDGLQGPAAELFEVAEGVKALQLRAARVVRGRDVDLEESFGELELRWERALRTLDRRYGS